MLLISVWKLIFIKVSRLIVYIHIYIHVLSFHTLMKSNDNL